MDAIRRRSSVLILVVICLVVLLTSGGAYTVYLTHTIKSDAEIINKLGVIRGSIQRLSKLEVGGSQNDELISSIESNIDEFKSAKIKVYDKENKIELRLNDLFPAWLHLKDSIYTFRQTPSDDNRKALLESSEEVWELSNVTVKTSQLVSEGKMTNYRISYIFFGINFVLGMALILLIKKYVRDKLEYLVNYDGLTDIYNRRYFNKFLDREIAKCKRYNRDFSLIMFDIDKFKKVNDTYGHDVGDSVLKELSKLIGNSIRKSDVLFRIGGEEFAIIVPETKVEEAVIFSEKIRKIVESHDFRHVKIITISLGITQFAPGDDINSVFKRADEALYKAKNNGRNRSEAEVIESIKADTSN